MTVYNISELNDLDFAITAALTLLPEKQRTRPAILDTLAHAAGWARQVAVDPGAVADKVAAADSTDEFDARLEVALLALSKANSIQMGPGSAFAAGLTAAVVKRRGEALHDEAAAVGERLRPVVQKTQSDLIAAAAELPRGADALDAEKILTAGAGEPWSRAHTALAVLLIAAGVTPRPAIGDAPWMLKPDLRHLQSVLPMIVIADAGTWVHDAAGADRTATLDPERAALLVDLSGFANDTATMASTAIMLSVAQGRWPAVQLGYDPTGKSAFDALTGAFTSTLVTRDQLTEHRAQAAPTGRVVAL